MKQKKISRRRAPAGSGPPFPLGEAFQRAVALHRDGALQEAERLYQMVLAQDKHHVHALTHLGTIHLQRGQLAEGLRLLSDSLAIDPNQVNALVNQAQAYKSLKRYVEALASFDQALALGAASAEIAFQRGDTLQALGRPEEALTSYDCALELSPDLVDVWNNRGVALRMLRRFEQAHASYERACALRPDDAAAQNNLALALCDLQRHEEALTIYQQLLARTPNYAEAHSNYGSLLNELKRYEDAIVAYGRALEIRPDFAEAHNNLGNSFKQLLRYDQALKSYDQALILKPGEPQLHTNRGQVLQHMGRYEEALQSFDRSIALKPDDAEAHWSKGILKLMLGQYSEGWALNEWRWRKADVVALTRTRGKPLWRADDSLGGKTILLCGEQGFGDIVHFSRYIPQVVALGPQVLVDVPASITDLIQTVDAGARVFAHEQTLPDFDLYCPLMSLPLMFGTTLSSIPAQVPYMFAQEQATKRWRNKLGPRTLMRVGLVWTGGAGHKNQPNRSMELATLKQIFHAPVEFHCLQKEIAAEDLPLLDTLGVRLHANELQDFSETAALVGEMDLVISVCTSVAHLAGALGVPVWILLLHAADFRWLTQRQDTPWYPTARLFRQRRPADWSSVIEQVAGELRQLLAHGGG